MSSAGDAIVKNTRFFLGALLGDFAEPDSSWFIPDHCCTTRRSRIRFGVQWSSTKFCNLCYVFSEEFCLKIAACANFAIKHQRLEDEPLLRDTQISTRTSRRLPDHRRHAELVLVPPRLGWTAIAPWKIVDSFWIEIETGAAAASFDGVRKWERSSTITLWDGGAPCAEFIASNRLGATTV